ncbi:competence/damage-inducible protein A [Alicyclobacillus fastidiosus]|uniref:Putative competence-damage inducible protein n=1 Tax=Alicyclobacillus fastidiosus TaxID=392011 RepID=A0ABY6ZD32_9BACL|nr:competence/damage-inducible protein A [Alicyclobacillus fastidiosus]WAH40146.1 competence/damage-inducible protein A [Alicyclobacillus fastidiosus]
MVAVGTQCQAELIAVGSEILLGQINNSHAQVISAELAKYGLYVYHHGAVGDNEQRIRRAFETASQRSNVVIVTGGLGPTADDLTKEALASFLDRKLVLSEEALHHLMQYFAGRQRQMPEENRKQAYCIEGGELIPNENGTAPGQYIFDRNVHFFLLPGPPLEMRPMLRNYVLPRLIEVFGGQQALISRVLHFCGIGESDVDEQIQDLTAGQNPTVAPLAGEGEMLLRITATADSESSARAKIAPVEEELRRRFGSYLYGVDDDTLPSVVGRRLAERQHTLSVAESCTGGLLASMLTDVPGSSAYFMGGVVAYDNRIKESLLDVPSDVLATEGAVSEATARALAEGVRRRLSTTYGIGVTGIAGPGGGTPEKPVGLVYVAVADGRQTQVYRLQYRVSRAQVRLRTCKQALWRLLGIME